MKELFSYMFKLDIKNLFVNPTKNPIIQFFRYFFVGGISFVVDAAVLFILNSCLGMHYMVATVFGFMVGLTVNYLLSIWFVFNGETTKASKTTEFVVFAVISTGGLLLTELLMWVGVEKLGMIVIVAKIIAAAIVLIWNYSMKKVILYRNK
ncbi:MAG: GtrA family protein [Oscillospiraceae bacterium]